MKYNTLRSTYSVLGEFCLLAERFRQWQKRAVSMTPRARPPNPAPSIEVQAGAEKETK